MTEAEAQRILDWMDEQAPDGLGQVSLSRRDFARFLAALYKASGSDAPREGVDSVVWMGLLYYATDIEDSMPCYPGVPHAE